MAGVPVKFDRDLKVTGWEATVRKQKSAGKSARHLLSDNKLLKNAICPDWPNYLTNANETVVVNSRGELSLRRIAKHRSDFKCKVIEN